MHLKRKFTVLATVAATAALAGCGGSSSSSGVSAASYVKSVCGAVIPFEQDVLSRSTQINPSTIKSAPQGKKVLHDFLSAISNDTSSAVTKLQSAGTPGVSNGKQISSAILVAFQRLKTTMVQATSQSSSLPTNSLQAFETGTQSIIGSVRNSMNSIGTSLQSSTLKSSDLQKAAAKEPSCKGLGSSA
jgi:hypothetical protein